VFLQSPEQSDHVAAQPLVLLDGDCGFQCRDRANVREICKSEQSAIASDVRTTRQSPLKKTRPRAQRCRVFHFAEAAKYLRRYLCRNAIREYRVRDDFHGHVAVLGQQALQLQ
jgi:hypothetical protein